MDFVRFLGTYHELYSLYVQVHIGISLIFFKEKTIILFVFAFVYFQNKL